MKEDLKAFLDGELPPERMEEIRAAIDHDAELSRELNELRLMSAVVAEELSEAEPQGLEETLAALNAYGRPRSKPWWIRYSWSLGMAAAGVVVLALLAPELRTNEFGATLSASSADAAAPAGADSRAATGSAERSELSKAADATTAADSAEIALLESTTLEVEDPAAAIERISKLAGEHDGKAVELGADGGNRVTVVVPTPKFGSFSSEVLSLGVPIQTAQIKSNLSELPGDVQQLQRINVLQGRLRALRQNLRDDSPQVQEAEQQLQVEQTRAQRQNLRVEHQTVHEYVLVAKEQSRNQSAAATQNSAGAPSNSQGR